MGNYWRDLIEFTIASWLLDLNSANFSLNISSTYYYLYILPNKILHFLFYPFSSKYFGV